MGRENQNERESRPKTQGIFDKLCFLINLVYFFVLN